MLKGKITYWDLGIGLGLRGESNLPNRTTGHCPVVMGVSLAWLLATASSAGSGETPQTTVFLSSYNPAGRSSSIPVISSALRKQRIESMIWTSIRLL